MARCSRVIRTVLTASPAIVSRIAEPTTVAMKTAALFRRANLRKRYAAEGGPASTGSSCRWRSMSAAKPLAVS